MNFTTPKRNQDSMADTPPPATAGAGDGSSIEVAKRPRGRPPGSKNKPKPPVIITQDSPHPSSSMMRPHILEIPANHDLIETLSAFSRRKSLGLCVLAGTGAVSNITIRQPPHPTAPPSSSDATLGFRGRFEILSLSATVMPPAASAVTAAVTVAGPQGQVLGGTVVGPLVTAGTVTVVAAAFENPTWHRLPVADNDVARSLSVSGGGDDSSGHHEDTAEEQQQLYVHRVGEYEQHHHRHQQQQVVVEPCGMGMYAAPHFPAPAEGIWAPTSRPPPN